jgi:hypothetical protein
MELAKLRLLKAAPLPDDETMQLHEQRERRFQLAYLLRLTEAMVEHAKRGEWRQLEELEMVRSVEAEECFRCNLDTESDLIAEALATLLQLNENLIKIVGYAQTQLTDERLEQLQREKTTKAYLEQL